MPGPFRSIYADLYIKSARRAKRTPRVGRPYRVKKFAQAGLMAFYRNRFYEIDRWYKARIEKPLTFPQLHFVDPDKLTKSLAERMEEMNAKDPMLHEAVDIGLPYLAPPLTPEDREKWYKGRQLLEQDAVHKKLEIDVKEVERESLKWHFPEQLVRVSRHFGIFRDLFHEDAFFHPVVPLNIRFDVDKAEGSATSEDQSFSSPVYYGNFLKPEETLSAPSVTFESPADSMWTLLLTNPDGNALEEGKEVVHWLIANIPGNRVDEGDVLCDYLQPLPFHGTGWHRFVFLLFRQDAGRIDLSKYKREIPCANLEARSFSTPKFYKENEDRLTPAGLAFFQSDWDVTVRDCLHNKLDSKHPLYAYEWPQPWVEPQKEYPDEAVPVNLYLDKYRDHKEVEKEILTKRLKNLSPFAPEKKREKYPNIFWYEEKHAMSPAEHIEKQKANAGVGKYRGLYQNPIE